jgi:hypothetical protein
MSMKTKERCGKLGGKAGMCMKTKGVIKTVVLIQNRKCEMRDRWVLPHFRFLTLAPPTELAALCLLLSAFTLVP